MASFALLICVIGIAGLFFLDRDRSIRTSKALWLPVVWFCVVGSRSVAFWLGTSPSDQSLSQQLEGSPADRLVFTVLLVAGIIVLLRRSSRTRALLGANGLIVIYFAYCLLSVLWSDYPNVAFKRWTKAIGDLAMVLIVATDGEPMAALKRFLSRTGFILLPISVLFIGYFDLGRGTDVNGDSINIGVADNKNALGLVTFVLALGALWRVCALLRAGRQANRGRHLLAQGTLFALGVALLVMADSATAVACFILGSGLIVATGPGAIARRPVAVHAIVLTLALASGLTMLFGGQAAVVRALGRDTSLTGRTDIWNAVIPATPNAVVGAGFESFWISPSSLEKVWGSLSGWFRPESLNEAHNGYIEVYLNLGWVGVYLIALILISGYRRACAAFRRDPEVGRLMLAYIATAAVYSITEAGFRMLSPMWICLLLAVVAESGVASDVVRRTASLPLGARANPLGRLPTRALTFGPRQAHGRTR